MRYYPRYNPAEPHQFEIHVNRQLVNGRTVWLGTTNDEEAEKKRLAEESFVGDRLLHFYEAVTRLPGMDMVVGFEKHFITLTKGLHFEWDPVLPHIFEAVRCFIAPDQVLEESLPLKSAPTLRLAASSRAPQETSKR